LDKTSFLNPPDKGVSRLCLAAKPLPATSQPAAPFPVGRSFGHNVILLNTYGVIADKSSGVMLYARLLTGTRWRRQLQLKKYHRLQVITLAKARKKF